MREPDDINNKTVFLWRQMSYQRVMLQHLLGTDEPGLLLLCYTPTPVPSNLINLRATVVMSISVFLFFSFDLPIRSFFVKMIGTQPMSIHHIAWLFYSISPILLKENPTLKTAKSLNKIKQNKILCFHKFFGYFAVVMMYNTW